MFPPCNYVREPQTAADFSSASFHIFSVSETKESFTFPWASALHQPPRPHRANKSLFNLRLDYSGEVIAWPSSSSPLSEGPPPNLKEQLFINVLLTSLLQCAAGNGPPLGIVLMGRARVWPVKQITAKGQQKGGPSSSSTMDHNQSPQQLV